MDTLLMNQSNSLRWGMPQNKLILPNCHKGFRFQRNRIRQNRRKVLKQNVFAPAHIRRCLYAWLETSVVSRLTLLEIRYYLFLPLIISIIENTINDVFVWSVCLKRLIYLQGKKHKLKYLPNFTLNLLIRFEQEK